MNSSLILNLRFYIYNFRFKRYFNIHGILIPANFDIEIFQLDFKTVNSPTPNPKILKTIPPVPPTQTNLLVFSIMSKNELWSGGCHMVERGTILSVY